MTAPPPVPPDRSPAHTLSEELANDGAPLEAPLSPHSADKSPHLKAATPDKSPGEHPSPPVQPDEHHVDVEQAKKTWNDTNNHFRSLLKLKSKTTDVEADAEEQGQFDLRDYLLSHAEDAKGAGWKFRSLGVSWSDLSVRGTASQNLKVPTIPSMALYEVIGPVLAVLRAVHLNPLPPKERFLIQNFDGCAKPGELVLVIGRPGAGCSTFLQAIANKRNAFLGVDGEANYGGISPAEVAKHYAGEIVYSEEDDNHHATLTVGQTLNTILRLKQPAHSFPGYTEDQFREEVLTTLLKMLNMSHTRDTLVGSATVRGVSGGERKRVSILETCCTNGSVMCWDNATRGLDASTALDYAKVMRVLTDVLQTTSFLTAYQASEGIWDLCDKILVIEGGRCVYYGPRTEARQYFVDLGFLDRPRSTSSDWITTCFDPKTRQLQDGKTEKEVPCTPEALEEAYRNSKVYVNTCAERDAYNESVQQDQHNQEQFRESVRENKKKFVGKKSLYNTPFWTQMWVLFHREMLIILGDPFDIFMDYFNAIALAFLTGGLFFKLPQTSNGLFTRGGVIFILLLTQSLSTFAQLSSQMQSRPVLARQLTFTMYRPAAAPMAQILADVPIAVPRVTIFMIILYFMSGLRLSAGAFFTAWLTIIVSYFVFKTLFTMFGVICRDFYGAARLAAVLISIMVQWAGYVQPLKAQHGYVKWLTYLDPVYYSFEALLINEVSYLTFTCAGNNIVPSGPGYPEGLGPNQVCTLPGARAGTTDIKGQDYLDKAFGFSRGHLWRDVGILFVFLVGFLVLTCLAIELQDQGSFSSALIVAKPPSKEEKVLNERLEDRRIKALRGEEVEANEFKVVGQPYTWSQLRYTVPVSGGQRLLLNSVDGYVKPGTVTALMGASGAGKTTLLDVLADRKTIGVIEGNRLVSGRALDLSFQRQCGYAEQQDIHEPMCSVREALRFSAYLRQPYETSKEEKDAFVETILELLEIGDLADAIVGVPGFGLGMGDRKRVTIGVELAAKPSMLLFLDEPTSGLDGQTALTICRLLRKLADEGQTVLCTIHQPSALLFEMFDRLLLLEKGGKVCYFGPIGRDACHMVQYFADRGAVMPEKVNPAEYMLEIIGAGSAPRQGPKDWADWYLESDLYQENLREIEAINTEAAKVPILDTKVLEYATPWWYQFYVVFIRTMRSTWRSPSYQYTRLIQHFTVALLIGLLLVQLDNRLATLQYRIFALFLVIVIMAVILAQIMPFWITARSVWVREETSKTFSGVVFASTRLVSELPYALVNATVFFLLEYYIIGFQITSTRMGYFFIMVFFTELFGITLGSMIASFCKSIYVSSLFIPFVMMVLSLTAGVVMPPQNMGNPLFYRFLYNVNPLRFLISGLVVNEFEGLKVECGMTELYPITPPANVSCQAYLDPYIAMTGGYVDSRSTSDLCLFCEYKTGMEMAKGFGMYFDERTRDMAFFLAFIGFNFIMTLICTKYLKFANR